MPRKIYWYFLFLLTFMLSAHGLAQTYLMGNTTITTCSGTFLDPGGTSDYPVGNTSTMTINPGTPGQYVCVNFTAFDVQQDWDVLYAYDGNSTAGPLIGIFSGTTSPGLLTASTANPTGSLTFRFISNWWSSGPEPGWTATISCSAVGGTPRYCMQNGATYTTCGGNFYDSGGPFHSYTWNENSSMTFCPATAGNGICLAFSPIDLEQDGDLLYLYDGPNTSSPLIAGFGNSDNVILPAQTITASTANATGCITAKFQSDGWWQNPGWSAAISCVPKTSPLYAVADENLNTCAGTFTDNGGAGATYMNFSSDQFTLCSDNAATPYVNLSFNSLDLWTGFDFLKVYDGTTTAAPLIASYTGIMGPFNVSSGNPSGCLTFEFLSDGWTTRSGWTASIGCSAISALPVTWLNFTGQRTDEGVALNWSTGAETGSWYFAVERYNGVSFDSIGSVPAAGNSSQVHSYSFIDHGADEGWNYYQLKEVDVNGRTERSMVVAIGPEKGAADVLLHYQETGATLLFEHVSELLLNLRIYESTGALVASEEHTPASEHDAYSLDPLSLSPGIYFIDVTSAQGFHKVLTYVKR